jgi:MSHA biogenesis protein MshQ
MLRRGCWAVAAVVLLMATASADTITFNGAKVSNCERDSKVYTCTSIPFVNYNDIAVIGNGYTVVLSSSFTPGYNQGLTMSGSAVLQTTGGGNIDLSASNNISISGGSFNVSGNFKLGASSQSITANVSAATITTAGASTAITGTVSATGAINFGSNTTINGSVSAASISTGSATTITGSLSVSGLADLGSSIKISGNVTANAVKTDSPAQIGGTINATTTISLGSYTTVGGSISGTTISTGSPVTLNGAVTASTSFTLASGSTVTGNITSPTVTLNPSSSTVKGNITTTGALDIGSGNTVTGSVNAGSLNLRASGSVINGTTKVSGDVDMESGTTINGDLTARNVTTHSSNAVINGNAAVNAIYIDWNNSVTKTITCTGPGAVLCSCVTKADPNYKPTCGAAPTSGAHHIQISHSGLGLTCQAQTVQLKACADASCSTTYTGATTIALSPGGGNVTFSGTGTGSVRQSSAATVTLSAVSSAITNPNVCINANDPGHPCEMVFSDQGLVLSAPDHVSMTPGVKLNIQALKTSPQGTCLPLVQSATVPIKFSCTYKNPLPASANPVGVSVSGSNISCGSATTDVSLAFDSNGLATPALQYSEVGLTSIAAAYTTGGLGASGAVDFTTAPAKIKMEPVRVASTSNFSSTAFAKGSEPFTIKLTALNYNDVATKNFGRESPSAQNFSIATPVLINPTGGNNAITQGSYKGIADGVADASSGTAGQWKFDDTGTIRVTAKLAHSSTYYLGNTTTGFNPQATVDLTFVPDHFDVAHADTLPMNCALVGGLSKPCSGKFLYSQQPFTLAINAYIGAKDGQGNYLSPQNYVGAAARAITLSAWTAADASVAISSDVTSGVGSFKWSKEQAAVTTRFSFSYDPASKKTVGTLTGSANLPSYDFRLRPTAPTTMYVRATDADLATSQGFAEPLLTIASGQMDVANVSGSLTAPVPVTTSAQYWNGNAYVFNSQFQLSSLPMYTTDAAGVKTYYVRYSNCQNGLDTSNNNAQTCPGSSVLRLAAPESISFSNGKGLFRLAQPAPALTRNGSVAITLKNSADVELIKYLPSGTGRVTFGVYRSGPVIYTREVYN